MAPRRNWTRRKGGARAPARRRNKTPDDYLHRIYFDPKHPASFKSANKVHEAVVDEGLQKIGLAHIQRWLKDQESYSLHKNLTRKFDRLRVVVTGLNDQYDADLADMHKLSKRNDGVTFLLVVIDVFSRYVWVEAMKSKTDDAVVSAFRLIFARGEQPRRLRTDRGGEFTGALTQDYLDSMNIEHWEAHNDELKAHFAERVIRTLKDSVWAYMRKNKTYRYVDVLQDLVSSYNNTRHRTTGMKPSAVTPGDVEKRLWWHLYKPKKPYIKSRLGRPVRYLFKKGVHVRISHKAKTFERSKDEKWTQEIFVVRQPFRRFDIRKYRLEDIKGEEIKGTFHEAELQKVNYSEDRAFDIEKVLETEGSESKVKWLGWPEKFNSWIPTSEVTLYPDNTLEDDAEEDGED